jgi:hypothetical protein
MILELNNLVKYYFDIYILTKNNLKIIYIVYITNNGIN